MTQRRNLQVDGVRLSYLEMGTAQDTSASEALTAGQLQPTLILVHGLMGCADTFLPTMEALHKIDPTLHIIALDLPGSGESERRSDIEAGLKSTAHLITRFIQTLDLYRPVFLGHSHGGAVGLRLAAGNPSLLRSLVLVAPAHPFFTEADWLIRFYLSLPGRLFAYTMPWYPKWAQLLVLRRMAGPKSWDTPERLLPYRQNLQVPGTIAHLLKIVRTWNPDFASLRRRLREPIATPSLLIWGDSDRAVPSESAAALREHLQYSELHTLPGIGHRPAEEVPTITAELVYRWLENTPELLPAAGPAYNPNSSRTHERISPLMTPNFDSGD
jgi:pimeloyl-ACP methyl ester carboxylesterase